MDLLKHGIPKSKLAGSISLQAAVGNLVNKARCFKASATGNKCVVADVPTLEKEMEVISRRCLPWMM